jgi:hypothetical protein
MKKRNKEYLKEKDFLRLQRASEENYEAQRNLGWIELDEPVHSGFTATLTLRSDVANREDAWIFQEIVDKFSTSSWAKKIKDFDFLNKENRNGNIYKNKFNFYHRPRIDDISDYNYNLLAPQVKKLFRKSSSYFSSWRGEYYVCIVPSFYFDIKIEKRWITKVRVFDEVLEQEEAEIDSEIERNHYNKCFRSRYTCAPKSFRKYLNRQQRAKAKQVLYKNFFNEKELEFEDNYKSASWLYW